MSEARRIPTLQRVAFKTSRLAEFVGQRELVAQTGHDIEDWPLVILKELVDNALDATEDAEIPPEIDIEVSTERGEITVTDNGPGLSAETIGGVLDYTVRVSSREAYISPTRGRQGNALKCIIAMPFALDGGNGCTIIESREQAHVINFAMDPVRREPRIVREIRPSLVQNGTRVTVHWPAKASYILNGAKARFVQCAQSFTSFNPHLRLRGQWDDWEFAEMEPTELYWSKWRTSDPTSSHWYNIDQFERYIAAHIARDQDEGREGRTVRDFISELDGLARTAKQKLVLDETETSRLTLARFFAGGRPAVARLLAVCQAHTKAVKPERLGLIGPDHLCDECESLGADPNTFQYRKSNGLVHVPGSAERDRLPFTTEVAFAFCPDESKTRRVVAGVNFSVGIGSPFERISNWRSLTSVLSSQHVDAADPVVVLVHYTCPDVQFLDRGKGILSLPSNVQAEIIRLIEGVTKEWCKQKHDEIKSADAWRRRAERFLKAENRQPKPEPARPTGVLAEKITTEADYHDVSIKALTVLSDGNDPYTSYKRLRDAELFASLFRRLVLPGQKRHLRGLFYRCVMLPQTENWPTGKPLINTYGNWIKFQKASAAARWLGLVPFSSIFDARNDEAKIYVPEPTVASADVSGGTGVYVPDNEDAFPSLLLEGFSGRQTHRIIFSGEKTSLAEVLEPIAKKIGAEMILTTGESSSTRLAEALERASTDGRPVVTFYFADFDPSGHQMSISLARKVQALRDFQYPDLDIKLYRVALTVEQAKSWGGPNGLPDKPLSPKERRADRWRERFDRGQTEIDAAIELAPEQLRDAVFDAIRPFYDETLDNRVEDARQEWQDDADTRLREHAEYEACHDRIEEILERLKTEVDALEEEQERAAEILKDALPEPPECPEAQPSVAAPQALFDSATDFVTATLRLIDDKKLEETEEDEDDDV
jgi:hypothetical protein